MIEKISYNSIYKFICTVFPIIIIPYISIVLKKIKVNKIKLLGFKSFEINIMRISNIEYRSFVYI